MRHIKRALLGLGVCSVLAGCGIVPPQQAEATVRPARNATPTAPVEATNVTPAEAATDVNDTPVLSQAVAPPTITETPTVSTEALLPVRMTIPAIGVDVAPIPVGLDENRIPIVPKHDVGWYELGSVPTRGENIVFWGHVLRWLDSPDIPAPFANVKDLPLGSDIYIYTANGAEHHYQITNAVQVLPTQVEYVLPTGKEQVTLVSCIGDNVIVEGTLTKQYRLVTIAEPVR